MNQNLQDRAGHTLILLLQGSIIRQSGFNRMLCINQIKRQFIIQIQHFFMFFKVVFNKQVHILNPKVQPSFSDLQVYIKQVFKHVPSKYQLSYLDEENDQITLANETDFKILKETSQKTVKIFIKQINEDFYDQTQQVQLDDQVQQIGNKIQQLKLQQKSLPNLQEIKSTSAVSSSKISQAQIDDSILEEKIRRMMPDVISKIKAELVSQGKVQQPKQCPKVQKKAKPVHPHITCDNCGKCPLEGVRYKCAVCADFDLCQQCESVNEEHDHPFLKIKHPKQAPYKIIAIIDDEHNSFEVNGQKANFPGLNQLIGHGLNHISNFFGQQGQHGHHGQGFGGRGCPFNKKQTKEQKKQQKNTKVQQPKKQTQKMNEYEKPCQKKVKIQLEEEYVPLISRQETQPTITEDKVQLTRQEKIMEAATYLSDILDIDYNRCYKFSVRNEFNEKEELLEKYFSNPNLL